ncbi:acyltransferase [Agarivorans sp. Toyoura001]|uniref:acyltransferase n=1 Tax=Agarivorans sp. Toyoura001 TaxID=2283141 RepID=UPI0010E9FAF7|nr:acyltransferase [Agarivorans sp. Toyoura001]GDY26346.1 acyltransferase [Agarivorans sp. Toyoura001]
MLRFLPTPFLTLLSASLAIINTALVGSLIIVCGLIKLLLPKPLYPLIGKVTNQLMWCWSEINRGIFRLVNNTEFVIEDNSQLNKNSWYLMICNHQSWADIVLLCMLFGSRIPMPKFFLKQQLLYVPFVGLACWALDMPFMRRYSRQYLLKHPEKRGKDLASTQRSCEKFKNSPTTVINFVEGTRFTQGKQQNHSTYQHLLPPKALGIAYTLSALGEQFDQIIDVTLAYPGTTEQHPPFKALLAGRLDKVVVKIDTINIGNELRGDYLQDKHFKRQFKLWLDDTWQNKDQYLQSVLKN